MQFRIGVEAISSYRRLAYTPWHALAEFIDNSTQAYFDNREALDQAYSSEGSGLEVSILYDRTQQSLTVRDNSIGMSREELEVALAVAPRPPRTGSRCKYGMGMKTAACWFGDEWQVVTKKLGDPIETRVTVDVQRIAGGDVNLPLEEVDTRDPDTHYTEIRIRRLHKKLGGRTVGKIREFLRSMFRYDLQSRALKLYWQLEPLAWDGFQDKLLRAEDGTPYRKELGFGVLHHRVHGWVGVLESGSRALAGFTLLQNNRVIRGYPDSWRPSSIYGQLQGSNDLINQRLVGELHLDTFEVSHTKDDIIWAGEEEEELERVLAEQCAEYRQVARTSRKGRDERGPNAATVSSAVDQLVRDLESNEIANAIELTEVPAISVVDQAFEAVVRQEAGKQPRFRVSVGSVMVEAHLSEDASPNDPYYALDCTPDETVIVVVNMRHPYMVMVAESSALADYLRHCVFDAIAEDKARKMRGSVHSNTVRLFKDQMLRVPYQIHDAAPDTITLLEDPDPAESPSPETDPPA